MQIDKSVPIPSTSGRGRRAIYPINSLNVGESFLFPAGYNPHNARMLVQHYQRNGNRYTTRTTPEGLRVWRIK